MNVSAKASASSDRPPALDRRRTTNPSAADAESTITFDGIFEDEIEQLVNTPLRFWSLSKKVRKFYHDFRSEGRLASARHFLLSVAFLNALCGITDIFIVPASQLALLLSCRLIITGLFSVATLPLYKKRSARSEAFCVVFPCVVLLLCCGMCGLSEGPTLLERYMVNACFVIAMGIVFLRIDSLYVTLLTLITCGLMTFFIAISAIEPVVAKVEIVLFHIGAIAGLWSAHRIQARYRYRGAALSVQNKIQTRKMAEMNSILTAIALTDPLTGVANRRQFDETLGGIDPTSRIAVLMIDIDHFKKLNDTFGHADGDRCLTLVARAIRDAVRVDDLAARFGGEEFAVLMRDANRDGLAATAERIRAAVSDLGLRRDHSASTITISIGGAYGLAANRDAVMKAADAALYEAKHAGRNRVALAFEPEFCA